MDGPILVVGATGNGGGAAARFSAGRPVRYRPATVAGYLRHLRRRRLSWTQCIVQTVLHTGLRRSQADHVDPTLGRLLGRPPTDLERYIQDHRALWAAP